MSNKAYKMMQQIYCDNLTIEGWELPNSISQAYSYFKQLTPKVFSTTTCQYLATSGYNQSI